MFQLPKLPELMMSIYDYDSLNTMFTKPPSVSTDTKEADLLLRYI